MAPGCLLIALLVRPSDPTCPRTPPGRGEDTFGDVNTLRNVPAAVQVGRLESRQETGGLERGSPVCSPRISRDKTTVKMGAELFTVSANETATFFRLTRPKTTVANLEMSRKWHHTSVHS